MQSQVRQLACLPNMSLNISTDPTLATDLFSGLFGCQSNEKVGSLCSYRHIKQSDSECRHLFKIAFLRYLTNVDHSLCCVSSKGLTLVLGLNNYVEPCYLVYDIEATRVDEAVRNLSQLLPRRSNYRDLVEKCRAQRIERLRLWENANNLTVNCRIFFFVFFFAENLLVLPFRKLISVLDIAKDTRTHWRYVIVAIRFLRALVRRDTPLSAPLIQFMLENTYSSHTSIVRFFFEIICSCMLTGPLIEIRTLACRVVCPLCLITLCSMHNAASSRAYST